MQKHNKHCPERKRVVLILRKQLILLLLLLLLALPRTAARAEETGPAAMILYEPRTGTVLEALHPDEPMLIASTTKIMTAMVVLEHCALNEPVTVTEEQTMVEGSSAYLQPDATYTVEDLLYGLMLNSGNDAACVLAAAHPGQWMEARRLTPIYLRAPQAERERKAGRDHTKPLRRQREEEGKAL